MEETRNERLHSVVLTDSNDSKETKETKETKVSNNITDNSSVCCFSNKWWFDHSGPAAYSSYDENDRPCCLCFDCCTWCFEFKQKKWCCCKQDTYCHLCCCRIHFF